MIRKSVKHKYFLWQILLIVVPFIILTVIFSLYSGNLIKSSYIDSEHNSLESLKMNTVEIYINRVETILENMDVLALVENLDDINELYETWDVVSRVFPEIEDIYFVRSNGDILSLQNSKVDISRYTWYENALKPDYSYIEWAEPYVDPGNLKYVTTAYRPVYLGDEFQGLLCIDLQITTFFESIKTSISDHSGKLLIINNNGAIMNLYRNKGEPIEFSSLIDSSEFINHQGFKTLTINQESYYSFTSPITALHLRLFSIYKASLINAEVNTIYVFIFIVLFIVFIVSGAIYVAIFNRVSSEIVRLVDYSDAITHGNLTIRTVTKEKDEFLILNQHLNIMVSTMVKQIDELTSLGKEKDALLEMRTNLIHILSHNATTPITVLFNTTGDLFEQFPDNKEFYSLYSCAASLKTLIDNSMTYAKIEGNLPVIKEDSQVCINEQLEILASVYDPLIHEKKLSLTISAGEEFYINTSSFYFKVVLENVFDNAVKYSFPDSCINIAIESRGAFAVITFKDGGPGFKPEDRDRLFNRFAKLSAKPTGSEISTGLGLYLTSSIIKALHGDIRILDESFSREASSGAVIELYFPLGGF